LRKYLVVDPLSNRFSIGWCAAHRHHLDSKRIRGAELFGRCGTDPYLQCRAGQGPVSADASELSDTAWRTIADRARGVLHLWCHTMSNIRPTTSGNTRDVEGDYTSCNTVDGPLIVECAGEVGIRVMIRVHPCAHWLDRLQRCKKPIMLATHA
jgi:hypothetical protein